MQSAGRPQPPTNESEVSISPSIPPMHFADWFRRHASTRPESLAVVTPETRLTYLEFYRALLAVTHRLAESGIEEGQTVAVCIHNQALHCVLLAALNRLGAATISVALSTDMPDRLRVDRLLVEQPGTGVAPPGALSVGPDWLKIPNGPQATFDKPGFRDGDAIIRIIATSGTTGSAKAVGLSTRQSEPRFLKFCIGALAEGHSGKTLSQFGLRTAGGFRIAFETFWAGGTLFLGFAEPSVARLVARSAIGRTYASPAQYAAILDVKSSSGLDFSRLKLATIAGSVTPRPLISAIRTNLCQNLIDLYGSTEVGLMAFGPLRAQDPPGHCGVISPWMQAQVVDEVGKILPAGQEGELRFRCEEMAHSYLNDPAASAESFRDGWFYPGDTGIIGSERSLKITGRISERINAGGVKANPELIENVVLGFAGIVECAAFGVSDNVGVQQIWAAVVARGEVDLEKLRNYCKAKLGNRAPHRFLKLAKLPRNSNGKISRPDLERLAQGVVRARAGKAATASA
jgi:long-chain acyl-CoA synthetase